MAPTPKPRGQRQRRNKDQSDWVKLGEDAPADGTAPDPDEEPTEPAALQIPKWHGRKPPAAAARYWESIWSSPMAAMYLDVDQPGIQRLCVLHASAMANKASVSELGELRQLEQLFGLSPRARRTLQWEVEKAAGPGQAHIPQPLDREREKRDRRARLSVV